jgi:uridine kinase
VKKVFHVAIVGGSGSGKTWLAERLCADLGGKAARLSLDDFYRDLSPLPMAERDPVNFDDPAAIDWDSARYIMDALTRGEPAQVPVYDFATHTRHCEKRPFAPRPLVIWDGLWLLHNATILGRFARSVFMDCGEAERMARRVERDVRERGRTEESIRRQFANHVQPMHAQFVEPQRAFAGKVFKSPVSEEKVADLESDLLDLISRSDASRTAR